MQKCPAVTFDYLSRAYVGRYMHTTESPPIDVCWQDELYFSKCFIEEARAYVDVPITITIAVLYIALMHVLLLYQYA